MPTLKRYKKDYKGVYYIMGTSAEGKPERIYYIRYRNKDGKQIDEKAGRQSKDDMSEDKAGLPKTFRPLHGLRHVYASMAASSAHVDMYTLQKLLTHKSPQMTQRYAHLRDDTLKKASNLAGELIDQIHSNHRQSSDTSEIKDQSKM